MATVPTIRFKAPGVCIQPVSLGQNKRIKQCLHKIKDDLVPAGRSRWTDDQQDWIGGVVQIKREMDETLDRLQDTRKQKSKVSEAVSLFMSEKEDIVPDECRDQMARSSIARFIRLSDRLFQDERNCDVFMALPQKEDRHGWVEEVYKALNR